MFRAPIKSSSPSAPEWVRPESWLAFPEIAPGEEVFYGLYQVDAGVNYAVLSAAGDYTVDWGDGIVENVISGTIVRHDYDYAALPATYNEEAHKQVIIKVTPQAGFAITNINLNVSLGDSLRNLWKDVVMSLPNLTSFDFYFCSVLERVQFLNGTGSKVSSYFQVFGRCERLKSVVNLDTSAATDIRGMFYLCGIVSMEPFDVLGVTSLSEVFANCYELEFPPELPTGHITDFSKMFQGCEKLQTTPLYDTSSATNLSTMFSGCKDLIEVKPFNTINCTDFSYIFDGCTRLKSIPALNTAKGQNFYRAFYGSSITDIGILDFSSATDISYMCYTCLVVKLPLSISPTLTKASATFYFGNRIAEIPAWDFNNVDSAGSFATNAQHLKSVKAINIQSSISFTNGRLSAAAIEVIFNNLVDMTGFATQTITLTGQPGLVDLTLAQRDIALNKNWTIAE